jgi:hypothetical protein
LDLKNYTKASSVVDLDPHSICPLGLDPDPAAQTLAPKAEFY